LFEEKFINSFPTTFIFVEGADYTVRKALNSPDSFISESFSDRKAVIIVEILYNFVKLI
jgi:hypothetical protein